MITTKKILSGAISTGVFVTLVLVASPIAHAQEVTTMSSTGASSAMTSAASIAKIEAEIAALKASLGTQGGTSMMMNTAGGASMSSTAGMGLGIPSTSSMSTSGILTANLVIGTSGPQVTLLQQWLIAHGFSIAAGVTGNFGTQTQAALAKYQASVGISPAIGFLGPITRAHINGTASTNTSTVMSTGTPSTTSTSTMTNTSSTFSSSASISAQMAAITSEVQGLSNDVSAATAATGQGDTGN